MKYKNISIWSDINQNHICDALTKDLEVDVLIIGGGITGLSTAYHLCGTKLNVCLVEKNEIASGVTSKTTGKLTYLQENILSKINTYLGTDKAKLYLDSQKEAINIVKEIIQKENIDCNLDLAPSYLFSKHEPNKIKKEMKLYNDLGINTKYDTTLPNGENVINAFYVENTYVFHPLKYLYALKEICERNKISIFENTNILSIDKEDNFYLCHTKDNTIKAKQVVLALHYPYFLQPFFLPLKSKIEKSYIEAYKVKQNKHFSAITITKPIKSIRYHSDNNKHYEIILSNSHLSCNNFNEDDNFSELIKYNSNPEYLWSNMDIITNDYLPFIGEIDDNLFIGTGYNTWGMTNGSLAGKIISDIILNNNNNYVNLFHPHRGLNLANIMNFPIILGSNVCSMIKTKIHKQKHWYPEYVKFEQRNGKNVAIYTDENKKEHIVYNICPHLKCSLIFNDVEKTWDCPCHGSRFDIDGNVIEGPSNFNITYKE